MATTTTRRREEEAAVASWQQIHGSDNWSGLLSPLDMCLRRELIRYGDFVTAISDGMNNVEESKLRFYPFYGKSALFSAVGLQHTADTYSITRYLYSTTYNVDEHGNTTTTSTSLWMGFIAVSRDAETRRLGRRDIVVSFRGAKTVADFFKDLDIELVPFPNLDGGNIGGAPLVHKGFLALYNTHPAPDGESRIIATDSLRWQVVKELRSLLAKYEGETVSVTVVGHSQGGALATLCAYDMATNGVVNGSSAQLLAAFTYASPKVGDESFREQCDDVLGLKVLRVVDRRDWVPTQPPPWPWPYVHTGVELLVDGSKSTYVNTPVDPTLVAHDLDGYLHTLAGIAGSVAAVETNNNVDGDGEFWLRVKRDIALVNKRTELLKDEYGIRKNWWVERNMGMLQILQTDDGQWIWRPAYLDLLTNLAADPDFV